MIDYAKIQRTAQHFARRLPAGAVIDADDLAQEYALAALKGRTPGAGPMLDLLRAVDPLSRGHRKAVKQGLGVAPVSLALEAISPDGVQLQVASPESGSVTDAVDLGAFLARLKKGRQRNIFQGLLDGKTHKEIAAHLCISESRVSQLLASALTQLREPPPLGYCLKCGEKLRNDGRLVRQERFCGKSCVSNSMWDRRRVELDAVTLQTLYLRKQMSITQIANQLGCGRNTVWRALSRYQIPMRPASVVPRKHCIECTKPVQRNSRRCRFHRLVHYAQLAREHRSRESIHQKSKTLGE